MSWTDWRAALRRAVSDPWMWAGICGSVVVAAFIGSQLDTWTAWRGNIMGRGVRFVEADWLLSLALVPLLLTAVGRSLTGLSLEQRVLSLVLRAAFLSALAFALARPVAEQRSQRVCQVLVMDVSRSVGGSSLEGALELLGVMDAGRKENDTLRLLTFAKEPKRVELSRDAEGRLESPSVEKLRELHTESELEVSDVERALVFAAALASDECENRILLASDGIETRGSMLSTVQDFQTAGTSVSVLPLRQTDLVDVAVADVKIPAGVRVGEPFEVSVQLDSTAVQSGRLQLYQGELLNGLDGVRELQLTKGRTTVRFQSVVRVAGDVRYRAEWLADAEQRYQANDRFEAAVHVPGPPRVLAVDRRPSQLSYFGDALSAQQLDVDLRSSEAIPRSAAEFAQFDFVVLSDLAHDDVPRSIQELLLSYVRNGGGLLFAGGEAGYGPGGWQGSLLAEALPVDLDARKEREIPGVAMSLVIDRSGSMTGLPLAMAKEACIATLGVLDPSDMLEVIAFDSRPSTYVKMQPARYRAQIETAVSRITPGGGTEIFNSLDQAYQSLLSLEARRKHVILLTDGNAGSDGLYELSSTAFADGITVTTVGLGSGANQSLLAMIAEAGGGRFHQAEDPSRLPRIFTRETELISKKATLDDWFPVTQAAAAQFLSGVDLSRAPLLRGYTSTRMRPAPAELVLQSDRGEPILARRPLGLGWVLAWTSDLKARWARDWLRYRSFGKLFAQLVREHQKSDDTLVRPMHLNVMGQRVVASVDAFDKDESFDSGLRSTLSVRPVGREGAPLETSFHLVAPGHYEAQLDLDEPGAYAAQAKHEGRIVDESGRLQWRKEGVSFGSVSFPYPEEYRDLRARTPLLTRLAERTGGRVEPDLGLSWRVKDKDLIRESDWQNPFILAAILLFLLDLFVRRVRLFDRDFQKTLRAS